jgi:membrane AbrB-like protein
LDEQARASFRRTVETAVIGGAGAALFVALHVPAGAILGAVLATAATTLSGRKLGWPEPLRLSLFLVMGFSAGATATPAAIEAALLWPLSIGLLIVATAFMWLGGWLVFRKLSPTDSRTAFYASSPGALSTVMILAEQQAADLPKVAVAQSLRLLLLVVLSPFALVAGQTATPVPESPPMVGGMLGWLIVLGAVLAGWALARRLRWPAPGFLGAMLGSAAVHAPGLVHAQAPRGVLLISGAVLGAMIGARFYGIRPRDVWRSLPACLSLIGVMAAIGIPVGLAVGTAVGVGPVAGLMAFAPGSMETMIAVSLALNAHPAYVAAHHLCRTLLLLAIVPALSAHWERRGRNAT